MLRASALLGSLTVTGYDGNEVVIEYKSREKRGESKPGDVPAGMHRLFTTRGEVEAVERNNVITVDAGPLSPEDIVVRVPRQASVSLKTVNGNLTVEGMAGEVDTEAVNGTITIRDAPGSVLAHSVNGKIVASLTRVSGDKMSSFSTMNGEIDVSLPADVKARLKMKSDHGDVFTDFDVKTDDGAAPTVNQGDKGDKHERSGRYRLRPDRTLYGTVNGGGPEIQFTTYNGRIVIRKK